MELFSGRLAQDGFPRYSLDFIWDIHFLIVLAVQHAGATSFPVGTYHAFAIDALKGYELKSSLQIVSVPGSMAGLPTCRRQWCQ